MKAKTLCRTSFQFPDDGPLMISGPCSAESEKQLLITARLLQATGRVHIFRAGIWKPRTRPASFTGYGLKAIPWLSEVTKVTGLPVCTEVALPEHIEPCLKAGIRIFWLGSRTVSNPFSVQIIADELKGADCCVMVKNPLNPDPELWGGALERLQKAGVKTLAAIHRGFYPFEKSSLRNIPKWELAIEMKLRFPEIPVICDASHIAGKRETVAAVAQKALDLNMDGLMIETHYRPSSALSDARQQLTPLAFNKLLQGLVFRDQDKERALYLESLEPLRDQVDSVDAQLIDLLVQRMKIVERIGDYKRRHNLAILQVKRWREVMESMLIQGRKGGLSTAFLDTILKAIHTESIRKQTSIYRKKAKS